MKKLKLSVIFLSLFFSMFKTCDMAYINDPSQLISTADADDDGKTEEEKKLEREGII